DRLDIEYDFLPRESEILHLHFWDAAFVKLKDAGVLYFETEGKNKGCWVMRRVGKTKATTTADTEEVSEEDQKVIVRSNGTLGYTQQADHYTHFSYEMVALTPRCAAELGYELSEEDKARAYIEVSGRKGFGVKADDLIDTLISSAAKEVDSRHPELKPEERRK